MNNKEDYFKWEPGDFEIISVPENKPKKDSKESSLDSLERVLQFATDVQALDEEIWRTLENGTHVMFNEHGQIMKGPKALKRWSNQNARKSHTKKREDLVNQQEENNNKRHNMKLSLFQKKTNPEYRKLIEEHNDLSEQIKAEERENTRLDFYRAKQILNEHKANLNKPLWDRNGTTAEQIKQGYEASQELNKLNDTYGKLSNRIYNNYLGRRKTLTTKGLSYEEIDNDPEVKRLHESYRKVVKDFYRVSNHIEEEINKLQTALKPAKKQKEIRALLEGRAQAAYKKRLDEIQKQNHNSLAEPKSKKAEKEPAASHSRSTLASSTAGKVAKATVNGNHVWQRPGTHGYFEVFSKNYNENGRSATFRTIKAAKEYLQTNPKF